MEAERKMINNFCTKLGVDERAVERSVQFYTQLSSASDRRNTHPSLKHPQVKVCICIEFACRQLKQTLEKSFLYKLAGISYKNYKTAFAMAESLVNLKNNVTMQQLGVQFSCSNFVTKASQIHSYYSNTMNCRQREMGHDPLDLDGPLYKAAALIAAAKMKRSKSKAREFCSTLGLSAAQLDTVSKDMLSLKDKINEEEVTLTFAQKIENKSGDCSTNGATSSKKEENLLWRFYPSGTLHSVYHKDFLEWKEKMIEMASS